jgi:hypothetical protein
MQDFLINARGRKERLVRVPEGWTSPGGGPSRDAGKHFLLTEWPAMRAEKWIARFILCITRSRAEVPLNLAGIGWQGIAILGWNTLLRGEVKSEELIPILDELLECVQVVRDPHTRNAQTGAVIATPIVGEDDIQEIVTLGWLRDEVVRLHSDFSVADAVSSLGSTIFSAPASPTGQGESSSTT